MTKTLLCLLLVLTGGFAAVAEDFGLESAREEWRAFRSLPKQDQRRVHKVYTDFTKLSPAAREETREWARRWLELSPEEKARTRHRLQRWERMSSSEKRALRERWLVKTEAEPES